MHVVPSSDVDVDVAVIGAGPVDLTLANELERRGTSVRVFEKAPAIREISKAMICPRVLSRTARSANGGGELSALVIADIHVDRRIGLVRRDLVGKRNAEKR
jgi:flavin-dependent dehydrogenase